MNLSDSECQLREPQDDSESQHEVFEPRAKFDDDQPFVDKADRGALADTSITQEVSPSTSSGSMISPGPLASMEFIDLLDSPDTVLEPLSSDSTKPVAFSLAEC